MLEKIEAIQDALECENYLPALALALTLPDICGQIEYPQKGKRNIRKQYATWFDEWVNQYYEDGTGWIENYSKAKNPYFTGDMCYDLRCAFFHSGNTEIKPFGGEEDNEFKYSYEFSLSVGEVEMFGASWDNTVLRGNTKRIKTEEARISINKLCERICRAAKKYYQERPCHLFKEHQIKYIDLSSKG